jgi:hypothetical protein
VLVRVAVPLPVRVLVRMAVYGAVGVSVLVGVHRFALDPRLSAAASAGGAHRSIPFS